jgi:UDP-glucuronate 4-epimerase
VTVYGCDSYTPYYDIDLKKSRTAELKSSFGFDVGTIDLCDSKSFGEFYEMAAPDIVFHLAAQPGVRQGIQKPHDYINANLVAFTNMLDMCRRRPPRHLLYASSSSVYGANTTMPWSEDQVVVHPVSLYAATKMANELMAHSYSHLTGTPMTGLRFFTVYGEWGRPDMAPYKFAQAIMHGEEITVFNHGRMSRDFTYVGDIVDAMLRLADAVPAACGQYRFRQAGQDRRVHYASRNVPRQKGADQICRESGGRCGRYIRIGRAAARAYGV